MRVPRSKIGVYPRYPQSSGCLHKECTQMEPWGVLICESAQVTVNCSSTIKPTKFPLA
jgi:hypothetical protein